MAQAAITGAIDFREADPRSVAWNLKLRTVLDRLDRQNYLQYVQALYSRTLALSSISGLTAESREQITEESLRLLKKIERHLFPWYSEEPATQAAPNVYRSLRDLWVKTWGDPNAPETQRRIAATTEFLETGRYPRLLDL